MKKFKGLVFTLMSFVVLLVGCDTDSKMGSVSDKLQIVTTLFHLRIIHISAHILRCASTKLFLYQ